MQVISLIQGIKRKLVDYDDSESDSESESKIESGQPIENENYGTAYCITSIETFLSITIRIEFSRFIKCNQSIFI